MSEGRNTGPFGVAGGPAPHIPVLASQVVDLLQPRDGGVYVDATFGAGGHTRLILGAADCRVIGLDRDASAIALGAALVENARGSLILIQERFSALESVLASLRIEKVDGVLIDLGVSSMQLDEPERGFSFRHDARLDMRMEGSGPSASDVVAKASERALESVIASLGEERFARRIAREIVSARENEQIRTTGALSHIVQRVVRAKPGDIHPATRTFQALRMLVNEELGELAAALPAAERTLAPGGRLAVISFHSLEDRIVKKFLASRSSQRASSRHLPEAPARAPSFHVLTPKPRVADAAEIAANPRARSAKLRGGERTDAPPSDQPIETGVRAPSLAEVLRGN